MKLFRFLLIFLYTVNGKVQLEEKMKFCENLDCDDSVDENVCGIKFEDEEVTLKLFDNECQLMKYGCQVDSSETYGIINTKYCGEAAATTKKNEHAKFITNENDCIDCSKNSPHNPVCGIRPDGEGFRVRTFENECHLLKNNCENNNNFTVTDFFICQNDVENAQDNENAHVEEVTTDIAEQEEVKKILNGKNVVVVDSPIFDMRNINQSIDNFFAATHVLDLPVDEMRSSLNESTRRRLVKIFGPLQVFKPWVKIPKNISDDHYHKPTLSSCYHKCPTKCPDTYAPVCGVPGVVAREPSLVFQNHCFMDVAQCKMHWEDKSYTAASSAYVEASFLFCLGEQLSAMYRFLPFIRTLQHMGRLKNKGKFKYKLKNMKFFNDLLRNDVKIMG